MSGWAFPKEMGSNLLRGITKIVDYLNFVGWEGLFYVHCQKHFGSEVLIKCVLKRQVEKLTVTHFCQYVQLIVACTFSNKQLLKATKMLAFHTSWFPSTSSTTQFYLLTLAFGPFKAFLSVFFPLFTFSYLNGS